MADRSAPRIDRPAIPASYGVTAASEFVDWAHVEERLTRDKVYWIATVSGAGRPRVRPIDGTYLDGVLYVGGSPETRWVAELGTNSNVSVHLDGLDDVIILEGEAEVMTGMGDELAERLAEASNAKFPEYGATPPSVYQRRGAIAIRPRKVISWTDITRNPTRFSFDR
ncbi:MAG: pyridoxamine 5'-phosphate oxidase family protein [Chloroflexi bacterium]|nr:pyridoxamine 5'-phosphate oxidase family protein [Chloroflexota bacterium]